MKTKKSATAENPFVPKLYKVLDFYRDAEDMFTLTINMKTEHQPGQFVQVSLPGTGEAPISIGSDSKEHIKLSIKEVGNVTKALSKLRKNDKILIRGPYGKGYPMEALKGNSIIIIGGGCGVAPLRSVIDYIENHRAGYQDVQLFFGYRAPNEILFKKEMGDWKKKYSMKITVDKNPKGKFCYDAAEGHITEIIQQAGLDNRNKAVFLCGPPKMMQSVIDVLKQKGFHDDQIFLSVERLMYCALGVCCHCMMREKFTCTDGPVFRYDEIKDLKND